MKNIIEAIYSLIRIKNKILRNTFKKLDQWIKIITVILVIFLLFNSIQSSSFAVQLIKSNISRSSKLFLPLFNLFIALLFISNLFTSFFFDSSNFPDSLFKTLLHYPIKSTRIILYEIISGVGNIINLLFVPFYIAVFFIGNSFVGWGEILTFLIIFLLFLISINGVIYLLKNFVAIIGSLKNSRKMLFLFTIFSAAILIFVVGKMPSLFSNPENLFSIEKILYFLPSGVYSNFIVSTKSGYFNYIFLLSLLYFIVLDALLVATNIRIAEFIKKRSFGSISTKINFKKSFLIKLVDKISINPFTKKDLIYTFRSFRTLFIHLLAVVFLPVIIFSYLGDDSIYRNITKTVSMQFMVAILINTAMIQGFAGNIFAFEYKAIVNYFSMPVDLKSIFSSKGFISSIYLLCNLAINLILFLFLKISFKDILFYEALIIFDYLMLLPFAFALSIYFPKRIEFWAMNGTLTSLVALILFIIYSVIVLILLHAVSSFYISLRNKASIILMLYVVIFFLWYNRNKVYDLLGKILIKRKVKIITLLQ